MFSDCIPHAPTWSSQELLSGHASLIWETLDCNEIRPPAAGQARSRRGQPSLSKRSGRKYFAGHADGVVYGKRAREIQYLAK
ncbi:hypothetical protein FMUAM8_49080 [Nocardia cyriacigeorgica]|nr:hypothetical protein FMUAM8_49080 [Nocardia cyriacigeorgica]